MLSGDESLLLMLRADCSLFTLITTSCWLIPLFRADFLHFTLKIVAHSRYLLRALRGDLLVATLTSYRSREPFLI